MKKTFAILIVSLAAACMLAGCATNNNKDAGNVSTGNSGIVNGTNDTSPTASRENSTATNNDASGNTSTTKDSGATNDANGNGGTNGQADASEATKENRGIG